MSSFKFPCRFLFLVTFLLSISIPAAWAQARSSLPQFEITLPAGYQQALTGRAFVMIAKGSEPEPRLQAGSERSRVEFMARDVDQLQPGQSTSINALTLAYPLRSVRELPAGDYYVQALFNVYTKFTRADGHVIWAHMDQWDGQQFNRSPGNLYSKVQRVHLDPLAGYNVRLSLTKTIPPVQMPADTQYVKHIKIQSKLLSDFWGQPIYLGATVLLPEGYDSHPDVRYPVIYEQGHFNLRAPLGFNPDPAQDAPSATLQRTGNMPGSAFYKQWILPGFPRMIAVTFQHPTVYFDDSYAVNSANNGPYGDAIMTGLIPYVEDHFRMIRQPGARFLTGGSTGGWEALALQVYHPDFFGGTWVLYPDPVDFRSYELVNIYSDTNAFVYPVSEWISYEVPAEQEVTAQGRISVRMESQFEAVLGSHARSGEQFAIWEATYGPVGEDGYPAELWDLGTGRVRRDVAEYFKAHDYDLRDYLERTWATLGPQLRGKIHVFTGDMDTFYLNLAVYRLEEFLTRARPAADAEFVYGRPMKPHGWQPWTNAALIRILAARAAKR